MNAHNIILFIIIITIRCDDEDLKVRIGLPEYICDKDGGVRDISADMTTIRLLGKDAQSVSYKFDVNFHKIAKKCHNNQRCTLLIWKAVRELDRYLKNYPSSKLQNGLIEINNTMFTPGVKYFLNVTVIKDGKVLEEKQLSLDYVDDEVRKKITKPMASLILLAPDTSYAYAAYVVNAEVNVCSNISSYYFQWMLTDSGENTTLFPSRTAELTIPPDTLQASQIYTIKCSMVNAADGNPIANSQQSMNVLSKGLLLRMPVKYLTTRTDQPVRIKTYMKDLDNIDGDIRLAWSCLETITNEQCEYESDSNELEIETGFLLPGKYKITLEISKSEFAETDSCMVEVTDNAPIVDIEEVEFPVNPSQGVEIHANVYELTTACTLQWTSPKEDPYEPLDLTAVPGNIGEAVTVTMKEDFFLHELEEFSNGTVDKRHNLIIPPPSDTWKGLKGDLKYLFRLVITCPQYGDVEEFNETEPLLTEPITATCDVIIETNAPPATNQLEMTPSNGDAFVTTFNFKTQKATDKEGDGPILYKFGYILDSRDVILWTLADVSNCEGTLPYSEDGVQTFVESCDNFNSCKRVLGPLVKTKLPNGVDNEGILKRFGSRISTEDYSRAFTEAFIILHSYKDEKKMREFIIHRIEEEIEKYLNMIDNIPSSANELMKNINDFNSQLKFPESLLNKLLELRNKLSDESENYIQRKLLSFRPKRASSLTLHDVRNYLEISELIITTSNDPNKVRTEKENLRKQLRNYMEKLCSNMKKSQLILELKTVIFSVEKLKKNSLNNFILIPFDGNSWQTIGRIKLGNVVKNSKEKCIGKALFRDYLDKPGIIYFADILNTTETAESEIVIYLPKNKAEGNPTCLVYGNSWQQCKVVQNIANYVKCSCNHLGYYHLEFTPVTNSPVMTTLKFTTPVPATEKVISNSNESLAKITDESAAKGNYDTISYVVIAASIVGIIILGVTIRKIFHDDDDNEEDETFEFPKYAQLHNEEFLNDAHI